MTLLTMPNHGLLAVVETLLNEGQIVTLPVKGNSMKPFIRENCDSVVLQKVAQHRIGDIVLARLDKGNCVLHRIVNIDDDKVLLMGDGNWQVMEQCKQKAILGKVIKIIRNGRNIDCTSIHERCKARMWQILLPFRKHLLSVYRRI